MKYTLLGFWPDGKQWVTFFESDPDDLWEAMREALEKEAVKNKWRDEDLEALTLVDVIEGRFMPGLGGWGWEIIPAKDILHRGPRHWSPKRKK